MQPLIGWLGSVGLLFQVGCSDPSPNTGDDGEPLTLREKYESYFAIGAAVDARSHETHANLLRAEFNSITPENEMKLGALHPAEGSFTFETADAIVAFAEEHGMTVRGHALVWHRDNPGWVFRGSSGGLASKDEVLARMELHITSVMEHFKGRVAVWDVVNEAIMNDGSLRTGEEEELDQQSRWHQIIGDSYIAEAFEYAHAADPDAKLFYNDYYNYLPARRQAIYELLEDLLDQGVPIHGVGLQCHLSIAPSDDPEHHSYYQTVENLEKAIELYSSLGLEVHITEMDVSLYVGGRQYDESDFYTAETFSEEVELRQAERYRGFFTMFRKHRDVIGNVTFWGIADDNTWLSEFSSGRTDFPLLFDTNHQPKKAYEAVMDF